MKHGRPLISPKPKSKSELVKLLNNNGSSPENVAKILNVSKVTIHNWMNKFEIKVTLPIYY